MNFKLLRWVILFVIYCGTCQLSNVLPEGTVLDKNGKPLKPVILPKKEIVLE
uniref:Venom peptide n=1 Tax=Comana monomorpha TaxID=1555636 RepID=A0AAU6PBP8_9NEOP